MEEFWLNLKVRRIVSVMHKEYKIEPKNSSVNGAPGTHYDWSKFDWDQKAEYDFGDSRYSTESEYIPKEKRGQLIGVQKAPKVFVDGNSDSFGEYLHVPYDWAEDATVYRVYFKSAVGKKFAGKTIKAVRAIKKDDGWYWQIEFEDTPTKKHHNKAKANG
jgi:hypothetical protein